MYRQRMKGLQSKGDRGFMGEVARQLTLKDGWDLDLKDGRGHSRQREQLKQRSRGRNGRGLHKKA